MVSCNRREPRWGSSWWGSIIHVRQPQLDGLAGKRAEVAGHAKAATNSWISPCGCRSVRWGNDANCKLGQLRGPPA